MKVLIIDDMKYKQDETIYALKQKGIKDYEIAESVRDALILLKENKFDIMIVDLGLPRFKGGFVNNPLEGIDMLKELSYRKMLVPAIVYSTTDIPNEDLIDLREVFEYPYLGQAIDIETLCLLLQIFIDNNKKTTNSKLKILIIDDIISFKKDIEKVLLEISLEDYDIVDNQMDALDKIRENNYDLLITGTLRYKFQRAKTARPEQGKDLLFILEKNGMSIPTIVYSKAFFEEDIFDLKKVGYPFIGQTTEPTKLKKLIQEYINAKNNNSKIVRIRIKKNNAIDPD